jgi:hypothetical protein
MFNKALAATFAASLVLAPLSVAYSADKTANQNGQEMKQPADTQNLTK